MRTSALFRRAAGGGLFLSAPGFRSSCGNGRHVRRRAFQRSRCAYNGPAQARAARRTRGRPPCGRGEEVIWRTVPLRQQRSTREGRPSATCRSPRCRAPSGFPMRSRSFSRTSCAAPGGPRRGLPRRARSSRRAWRGAWAPRSSSCRRACSSRTSPAFPSCATSRPCARPSRGWGATPSASTRSSTATWSSTTRS